MHLGPIDGPFVPHILISTQESPVPLPKLQMTCRSKILMTSGSKKRTQIYFSFLSKVLANEPPSRFHNRIPMERGRERPIYRAFCTSLKNLIFWVPSKGALPQGPFHVIPHREMPHH